MHVQIWGPTRPRRPETALSSTPLLRRCCARTASWPCTTVERCRLRVRVMRSVVLDLNLRRCEGLKDSTQSEGAISLIVSPTTSTSTYSLMHAQRYLKQSVAKIQEPLRRCSMGVFFTPPGPRLTPASAILSLESLSRAFLTPSHPAPSTYINIPSFSYRTRGQKQAREATLPTQEPPESNRCYRASEPLIYLLCESSLSLDPVPLNTCTLREPFWPQR